MKFELDKHQLKEIDQWKQKIKEKHGKYGHFDYIFTPFGAGTGVKIYSHLEKEYLDVSDTQDW